MDWHCLGHAMWLADLGDIRVLFDPLLGETHSGGVFEVAPRRTVDAAALRPDFIVVSHAHPDHFDVPSLRELARLDADSVVLTSDELVEAAAKRLGFRTVARLEAMSRVDVSGGRLVTTPSYGGEIEWGVLVETADGLVWNQVDTVHRDDDDVRSTLESAAGLLEHGSRVDLALARWQPLLEVEPVLAGAIGFPLAAYGRLLDQIAAIAARALVPSSAGVRHVDAGSWMNRCVYPLPQERFLRDISARVPDTRAFPGRIGDTYTVSDGVVSVGRRGAGDLVTVDPDDDGSPSFRPLEIPPLTDPNPDGHDEASLASKSRAWLHRELAPALGQALARVASHRQRPLSLVVEVVLPSDVHAFTFLVDGSGAAVREGFDDDYDVLNAIAASALVDVFEGRRHWGEPLLGGLLRACSRAYDVGTEGAAPADVGVVFLYYALSYADSVRRAIDWQVDRNV